LIGATANFGFETEASTRFNTSLDWFGRLGSAQCAEQSRWCCWEGEKLLCDTSHNSFSGREPSFAVAYSCGNSGEAPGPKAIPVAAIIKDSQSA
jgi:hypothetical protein